MLPAAHSLMHQFKKRKGKKKKPFAVICSLRTESRSYSGPAKGPASNSLCVKPRPWKAGLATQLRLKVLAPSPKWPGQLSFQQVFIPSRRVPCGDGICSRFLIQGRFSWLLLHLTFFGGFVGVFSVLCETLQRRLGFEQMSRWALNTGLPGSKACTLT